MSTRPDYLVPEALADWPLFAPLAPLLRASGTRLPSPARINALIAAHGPVPHSGQGVPVRFAPPAGRELAYEHAVFATGEVATRPDNWHDYFNALVWASFPRAKAALNARHMHELALSRAHRRGRGAVRDALTQFDECGIVVIGSDAELLGALARHEWASAFWTRRARLTASTRFLVFGHASYDQLRTPFPGLCAKALYLAAPESVVHAPLTEQLARVDEWLAERLGDVHDALAPAAFGPLPLLGIPGLVRENAVAEYYSDTAHFRPLGGRSPAPVESWSGRAAAAA